MVGRLVSFWDGFLAGAILVSGNVIRFIENVSLSSNIPTLSGYVAGWFTPLANLIQGHPPHLGNRLRFVEESRSQELQQEFFFGEKKNMTKTLLKNGISAWVGGISGSLLCVCVPIYIYIYLFIYLSIYKFIYLFIYSFTYLFIFIHSLELKGRS